MSIRHNAVEFFMASTLLLVSQGMPMPRANATVMLCSAALCSMVCMF